MRFSELAKWCLEQVEQDEDKEIVILNRKGEEVPFDADTHFRFGWFQPGEPCIIDGDN